MKNMVSFILVSLLIFNLTAQNDHNYAFNLLPNFESNNDTIKLNKSFRNSTNLKVLIAPQFGSLFSESFKYIKGIKNFQKYYNDFDLGFNLGIKYEILKELTFSWFYNIGVLKFSLNETNNIDSAMMKTAICYNF